MQRFVLQENIASYRLRLAEERDEGSRRVITRLLVQTEREYALISSVGDGATPMGSLFPRRLLAPAVQHYLAHFRAHLTTAPDLCLVLDPGPGLPILEVSDSYAAATMTERATLLGRSLFAVFPDNPDEPDADGVANLYASLRIAADTGRPHEMPIQRYDVRDKDGVFVERHWRPINSPVHDDGTLILLLHQVYDVTAKVTGRH
jgi:PAS domain-containing protein